MKIILLSKLFLLALFIFGTNQSVYGQNKIAITIDDVPNTRKFKSDNYHSILLDKLDSLNIPISIFVNESLIYKTDTIPENLELLDSWAKRNYITLGNHTFSHLRYSEVGYNQFESDIEKGELFLRELTNKYEKPLKYFRFPYNDLGIDSFQHQKIDSLLQSRNYISTPFTIESSDWMFNYIYEYYILQSNFDKANEIGQLYVSSTIAYFNFFDSLSYETYGRNINQIYLCHDNSLNANYLSKIIKILKTKKYQFISLDEAMSDPVYKQPNRYQEKWGISWIYRWMGDSKKRSQLMRDEPNIDPIYKLYDAITKMK